MQGMSDGGRLNTMWTAPEVIEPSHAYGATTGAMTYRTKGNF